MSEESNSMTSVPSEVRRIDNTGAIWFGAAIITTGTALAGLFAHGWHPSTLPPPLAFTWWAGAMVSLLGILALAWSGCPVLGPDIERADRDKSFTIRVGVIAFLLGSVAAALAVLLG